MPAATIASLQRKLKEAQDEITRLDQLLEESEKRLSWWEDNAENKDAPLDAIILDWLEREHPNIEVGLIDDENGEPTRLVWCIEAFGAETCRPTLRESARACMEQKP